MTLSEDGLDHIAFINRDFFAVQKVAITGTFPVDRFWGGERARRV
jgi:hypothetical protein